MSDTIPELVQAELEDMRRQRDTEQAERAATQVALDLTAEEVRELRAELRVSRNLAENYRKQTIRMAHLLSGEKA